MKVEFPTASAQGHTRAAAARDGFLICSSFAVLKTFQPQRSQRTRKEMPAPRVQVETSRALPASREAIGKENSRRDCPACLVSFSRSLTDGRQSLVKIHTTKPVTTDHRRRTWSLPTNSAAPSPISASPSPTAATTSASTAAPATKARTTATCHRGLPAHGARARVAGY